MNVPDGLANTSFRWAMGTWHPMITAIIRSEKKLAPLHVFPSQSWSTWCLDRLDLGASWVPPDLLVLPDHLVPRAPLVLLALPVLLAHRVRLVPRVPPDLRVLPELRVGQDRLKPCISLRPPPTFA